MCPETCIHFVLLILAILNGTSNGALSLKELLALLKQSSSHRDLLSRVRRQPGLDDFTKEDLEWLKRGQMGLDGTTSSTPNYDDVYDFSYESSSFDGWLGSSTTPDSTPDSETPIFTYGFLSTKAPNAVTSNKPTHSIQSSQSSSYFQTQSWNANSKQTTSEHLESSTSFKQIPGTEYNTSSNLSNVTTKNKEYITNKTNIIHLEQTTHHVNFTSYDASSVFPWISSANSNKKLSTTNSKKKPMDEQSSETTSDRKSSETMSGQESTTQNSKVSNSQSKYAGRVKLISTVATVSVDKPVNTASITESIKYEISTMQYPQHKIRSLLGSIPRISRGILEQIKYALKRAYQKSFVYKNFSDKDVSGSDLREIERKLFSNDNSTRVVVHHYTHHPDDTLTIIYSIYRDDVPLDSRLVVEDIKLLSSKQLDNLLHPFTHIITESTLDDEDPVISKESPTPYWVIGAVLGPLGLVLFLIALLLFVCKQPKTLDSSSLQLETETPVKQIGHTSFSHDERYHFGGHNESPSVKNKSIPLFEKRDRRLNSDSLRLPLDLDSTERSVINTAGEAAIHTRRNRRRRTHQPTPPNSVMSSPDMPKRKQYPKVPEKQRMIASPVEARESKVKYTYVEVYPEAKQITPALPNRSYAKESNAEVEVSIEVDGGSKQLTENYLIGASASHPENPEDDSFSKIKQRVLDLLDDALKLFTNYPTARIGNVRSYDVAAKPEDGAVANINDIRPGWKAESRPSPDGQELRPKTAEQVVTTSSLPSSSHVKTLPESREKTSSAPGIPTSSPLGKRINVSLPATPIKQRPRTSSYTMDPDTGLNVGDPAIPVIRAIREELKKYNSQ